jgi:DMSO/TMAO reductase YedYZ molybdopterin-dependent catalytic subunit
MKAQILRRASVRPAVVMDPSTPFKRLGSVSRLRTFVTPTADVHVLAHLGVARVDPERWQLGIDGMVERPIVLDLDELLRFPARELTAVFECYGNPLEPDVPARSVANFVWRGVSLAELLARSGVRPEMRFVWLEGMDSGDVLVAYAMNGEPLTHEHGFPARAVVPGYFGRNSVKWLSRITLAAARPEGLFTTRLYNRRVDVDGREDVAPAHELDVNAVIVRPADRDRVPPGRHLVTGWAWSSSPITRVELSTDGGTSWHASHVVAQGPAPAWQRFGFEWDAAATTGRNAVHAITVVVV